MDLENAEEILQILERYTKQKSRTIPDELNGYLSHVALTGDSVYSWPKVQYFFREKLAHVLKDFHDTTPRTEDLPISRNVDPFNYDAMKTTLLERFDLFNAAPFTIQRLSELLSEPKKHYCRLDKFMRALEKNILVVSTVEPGHRMMGSENGDSINGDPLDINVDVEMDKEPSGSCVEEKVSAETQPEASADEMNTETKTDDGTSEQSDDATTDDANSSTNGHHSGDELNDTIEDIKDDETTDKTDISSASVEPSVPLELQPAAEVAESLPEESAAVTEPIVATSPAHTPDIEQPKETEAEEVDGKVVPETDSDSGATVATIDDSVDSAETDVEMVPTIDGAEQMAVEDPVAPVPAATTNADSAMDATQSNPSAADEQMDVLENNSMDQDL